MLNKMPTRFAELLRAVAWYILVLLGFPASCNLQDTTGTGAPSGEPSDARANGSCVR